MPLPKAAAISKARCFRQKFVINLRDKSDEIIISRLLLTALLDFRKMGRVFVIFIKFTCLKMGTSKLASQRAYIPIIYGDCVNLMLCVGN